MNTQAVWQNSFNEAAQALQALMNDPEQIARCGKFSDLLVETISSGGTLFACGNGGSHCDAMHFAEEWTGRYRKNRRAVGAMALGDASHTTCTANDFGFEYIFSRQIDGLGRKGDLLLGISTSGNSKNVIRAVEAARAKGMKTVALLGKGGGELKGLVDLAIVVPGQTADRIQELHIKLIHIAIEAAERRLFPENY